MLYHLGEEDRVESPGGRGILEREVEYLVR
jgi:hypothetical protein